MVFLGLRFEGRPRKDRPTLIGLGGRHGWVQDNVTLEGDKIV